MHRTSNSAGPGTKRYWIGIATALLAALAIGFRAWYLGFAEAVCENDCESTAADTQLAVVALVLFLLAIGLFLAKARSGKRHKR